MIKINMNLGVLGLTVAVLVVVGAVVILPKQSSKTSLSQGQLLYDDNCASCHGNELEGQDNWQSVKEDGTFPAPPHDKTGHTWHHTDALLFDYTKLGGEIALKQMGVPNFPSGMPAFEALLSDDDILAILSYIKSTWPERLQIQQSERSQAEFN